MRNNPRENHISFYMKDVFDSVKSDSNTPQIAGRNGPSRERRRFRRAAAAASAQMAEKYAENVEPIDEDAVEEVVAEEG